MNFSKLECLYCFESLMNYAYLEVEHLELVFFNPILFFNNEEQRVYVSRMGLVGMGSREVTED